MGVCLSRCGETRHQAGPATISHRNYSFDNNTESLKKFLHLHANLDTKNSSLSSPDSTLVIPHSSELFSLPASEPDRTSFAISPSPGRTSRASVSSHFTDSSPKHHTPCSWGGRFSVDKTSPGCKKRVRPTPRINHNVGAHQRLIEAIARLERLNDGKQSAPDTVKSPHLATSRSRRVRHFQLPKSALCPPDTAMATPMVPLTSFLQDVESFVSLMETPPQETKSVVTRPVIPRLPRCRFDETDSDEMFTFFEATSEEDCEVRKKPLAVATSLHRLVQSATQGYHRVENLSPVAEKAPVMLVGRLAKSSRECRIDPSSKPKVSVNQFAEQSRTVVTNIESTREEKGDAAARIALADIDMNGVAMVKKSPSVRRSSPSRMRALKGFRRRLSRSLDSRESAVVHVDLDCLLRSAPIATSRLSNVVSDNNTSAAQVTLIDAKSTEELRLLPATSMPSCLDIKLEQAVCDQKDKERSAVEFLDTAAVELATSEQPSQQEMLVDDQSPTTRPESCLREPESFEKDPSTAKVAAYSVTASLHVLQDEEQSPNSMTSAKSSFRVADKLDNTLEDPETNARWEAMLTPESTEGTESASSSPSNSCPIETGEADVHPIPDTRSEVGDSQRFLSKAFDSLFKLLLVTEREQTGPECNVALDRDGVS